MRDGDDGHVGDSGVGDENVVDLGRLDVLPTGDDHVFEAVVEEHVSPVIHGSWGTAVIFVEVPNHPWITGIGAPST